MQNTLPIRTKLDLVDWLLGHRSRPDLPYDPTAIVTFLRDHRILGRALSRMDHAGGADDSALRSEIVRLLDRDRHHIEAGTHALVDFIRRHELEGERLVILKGNAPYFFTRDPSLLRASLDVDILAENPGNVRDKLTAAGIGDAWMAAAHEEINVFHNGIAIDVHRYMPVYRILTDAPLTPINAEYQSVFKHSGNVETAQLRFEDLLRELVRDENYPAALVYRLSAAASAFVSAMHLYSDFIRPFASPLRFRPMVRLAEPLDIIVFLRHPTFDREAFLRLVSQYRVLDEVNTVARMTYFLTGDRSLLDIIGAAAPCCDPFATSLFASNGFQFSLDLTREDIVAGSFGLKELIPRISHEPLSLDENVDWRIGAETPKSRAVHQHGPEFRWSAALRLDRNVLTCVLDFQEEGFEFPYVSLTVGSDYYRVFPSTNSRPENSLITSDNAPIRIANEVVAGVRRTHFAVHFPPQRDPLPISIVLGNVKRYTMDAGVLIPLVLLRR